METNKIELTPEQMGILASMSQETGESVDALLDKALDDLQANLRARRAKGAQVNAQNKETPKPIWQQFAEAFDDIPDDELEKLPIDGAANVDHYVYGLPKRHP
jgi:hypothetical protein